MSIIRLSRDMMSVDAILLTLCIATVVLLSICWSITTLTIAPGGGVEESVDPTSNSHSPHCGQHAPGGVDPMHCSF